MSKGKIVGLSILAVLGLFGAWIVLSILGTATTVATAPGRVINRTLDTGNIIHNYEWFYDTNAAFQAKLGQIKTHYVLVAGAAGSSKERLAIELAAMQQTCRELVTRYNANATKINRSIFRGTSTPDSLNIMDCE